MKDVVISADMMVKLEQAMIDSPSSIFVWSDESNEVLRKFYGKIKTTELGVILGRNEHQIRHQANKLGLYLR